MQTGSARTKLRPKSEEQKAWSLPQSMSFHISLNTMCMNCSQTRVAYGCQCFGLRIRPLPHTRSVALPIPSSLFAMHSLVTACRRSGAEMEQGSHKPTASELKIMLYHSKGCYIIQNDVQIITNAKKICTCVAIMLYISQAIEEENCQGLAKQKMLNKLFALHTVHCTEQCFFL